MIIKDIAIIGVGNLAQSLLYRLESSKAKVKIRLYDKNTKKKSLVFLSYNLICTLALDDSSL